MDNKGFSLIELLVTIAISGIVLLMISFMLVQGTNLFKSENEEIDIQNELQIVRNQLSETIMGAKSLVIVEAGEDIVIYTGDINDTTNRLVAENNGEGGVSTITTERIITYDSSENKLYISSQYASAVSEGNLISQWVTDFDISIDEKCFKTVESVDGTEQYYVNPLSVDITLGLAYGNEESDVDISVRVRNILSQLAMYKTDSLATLLKDATVQHIYKVK